MKRHFLYLLAGVAFTVCFFITSTASSGNLFEWLFYNQGLNDHLFNLSVYPMLATIIVCMAWGAAAVYYFVINSVKFDRWWHWLSVLVIVSLVTPLACHAATTALLAGAGMDYGAATVQFGLQHIMWTALLFVVASFSMRWWSTNCRHTPIPE